MDGNKAGIAHGVASFLTVPDANVTIVILYSRVNTHNCKASRKRIISRQVLYIVNTLASYRQQVRLDVAAGEEPTWPPSHFFLPRVSALFRPCA